MGEVQGKEIESNWSICKNEKEKTIGTYVSGFLLFIDDH